MKHVQCAHIVLSEKSCKVHTKTWSGNKHVYKREKVLRVKKKSAFQGLLLEHLFIRGVCPS